MKVLEGTKGFPKDEYAVVTSGTFDGVHFGHRKILKDVVNRAQKRKGISVVLTYWPHPRFVLKGEIDLQLLSTFEEKVNLISEEGIDYLVKIPFTRSFSEYSSQQFIQQVLIDGLGCNELVIGYDHRFGKNREGSFEYLKDHSNQFGFMVEEIPAQDIDSIAVSSTKIRNALLNGDIGVGNQYLGQKYSISGTVIKGDQIGRTLGYPTANIHVMEPYKLIPGDGIYAVEIKRGNTTHHGMLYIGPRPTLEGKTRNIEVNIFDFDEDIYGETLTISFLQQTRKDSRFEDMEALKKQLARDKEDVLNVFNTIRK